MDKKALSENWNEIKEEIAKTWSKLTKEDFNYIKGDLAKLKERLHEIYEDLEEDEIEETLQDILERTESKLKRAYENIKEYTKKGIDTIKETVPDAYEQTKSYIKNYPLPSVVISVAVGFIIGALFSSKK
jgi:ElaB/YqjD/DUF883 family membrane-anchored ribosome-binding protein